METSQSWGRRGKRTSVIALGLVAILAGIAVAYFIATATVPDNLAKGGTLAVSTDLPLNFTGGPQCATATGTAAGDGCDTLYPVNATTAPPASALEDSFTVTNNNAVDVVYSLYATCVACVQNPGSDEAKQFDNLYIQIVEHQDPAEIVAGVGNPLAQPADPIYTGPLSLLNADNVQDLGTVTSGNEKTYDVKLWLHNIDEAQPQAVLSNWEFVVDAKTPGA